RLDFLARLLGRIRAHVWRSTLMNVVGDPIEAEVTGDTADENADRGGNDRPGPGLDPEQGSGRGSQLQAGDRGCPAADLANRLGGDGPYGALLLSLHAGPTQIVRAHDDADALNDLQSTG